MHPEIENLINMALADGEVTEKERAIILRKAESLDEDKDEVEMILNGKIALLSKEQNSTQSNLSSKSNKEGDLKKCPSCGGPVQSFKTTCSDCGHEFRGTKGVSSILALTKKIDAINFNVKDYDDVIEGIISNFPIPNTKEDLLEFISIGISKAAWGEGGIKKAWADKADEAINKLDVISTGDKLFQPYVVKYRKMLKKKKNKSNLNLALILIGFFLFFILAYYFTVIL